MSQLFTASILTSCLSASIVSGYFADRRLRVCSVSLRLSATHHQCLICFFLSQCFHRHYLLRLFAPQCSPPLVSVPFFRVFLLSTVSVCSVFSWFALVHRQVLLHYARLSMSVPFSVPQSYPPSMSAPFFVPRCCLSSVLHYARLIAIHRQCCFRYVRLSAVHLQCLLRFSCLTALYLQCLLRFSCLTAVHRQCLLRFSCRPLSALLHYQCVPPSSVSHSCFGGIPRMRLLHYACVRQCCPPSVSAPFLVLR